MAATRRRMFQAEMDAIASALENVPSKARLVQLIDHTNAQLNLGGVPAALHYRVRGGRPKVGVIYFDIGGIPTPTQIEFAAGLRDVIEPAVLV